MTAQSRHASVGTRLLAGLLCGVLLAPTALLPRHTTAQGTHRSPPVVGPRFPAGAQLPELSLTSRRQPQPVVAPAPYDHVSALSDAAAAGLNQSLLSALLRPGRFGLDLTRVLGRADNHAGLYAPAGQEPNAFNLFPWAGYNFAAPAARIDAPTDVRAQAVPGAQIKLTWNRPAGAVGYLVERSSMADLSGFQQVAAPAEPPFIDGGVSTSTPTAYLYRVRAVDGAGVVSGYSNRALATNVPFTDDPLAVGGWIKAQHLVELRQAVNAVRRLAFPDQQSAVWQYPDPVSTPLVARRPIYAADVRELRVKVDEALAALGFATLEYQPDPTLSTGAIGTWIKAAHFQTLRERVNSNADTPAGVPASVSVAGLADPVNGTGSSGVNPYSRNFNWTLPLVSLPGRAGLDFGLALAYNTLVWTKDGQYIQYDADRGFPAPGFRLGFPVIQPLGYSTRTSKYTYLLITPAGARVELRQTAANIYEAADSSYLQLIDNGAGTLALYLTDGTRLSFAPTGGQYHCEEVRDRNGNYLTATYDAAGRLTSVTDTLGRIITFNYTNGRLSSITQPWQRESDSGAVEETHTWATFGYDTQTLANNTVLFSGLTVVGPQGGTSVPVLTQVGLPDGSYYRFDYTAWGQVWQIRRYSPNSIDSYGQPNFALLLAATWLGVPGAGASHDGGAAVPPAPQTDCPRFSERRDWIKFGVENQDAEITTAYTPWAQNLASCDTIMPDGTVLRESYATAGWQKGLVTTAEIFSADDLSTFKKQTTLTWTQDDTTLTYPQNPRITDTTISDAEGNHRRTSVTYTAYGLPQNVTEYAADMTTALRATRTEYNLDGVYVSRRIIGLPALKYIYEGTVAPAHLRAKVGYVYDDAALDNYLLAHPAATNHYAADYSLAQRWRGNLNRVRRYELNTETWAETGNFTESKSGYYITGTLAYTQDAVSHQTTIDYQDRFYLGVNRANPARPTYAYPTTVTDPDGYSVTSGYNYDLGAVIQVQTPQPNLTTYQPGPVQTTRYDEAGRVARTIRPNGAYRRLVYVPDGLQILAYETVTDGADEAYHNTVFDGAGRVQASAAYHPGSAGGFSGQQTGYDRLGRVVRTSNPTEMGGDWAAAGDDDPLLTGNGWVYTRQSYDWQGRPLVTIYPKTNPTDQTNPVREFSYDGCGCAGGKVVTITDEMGRRQTVYHDMLGRVVKVERYHGSSVDSVTTTRYNALDQVTRVRAYAGAAPQQEPVPDYPATAGETQYQTSLTEYEGYGRPRATRAPGETAATEYKYYNDDRVSEVQDARGMKTQFTYNGRGLVTGVTYDLNGHATVTTSTGRPTTVEPTPAVTYTYDAAGNRKTMTTANNATGNVTYTYDPLSRLTSEARQFPGLAGTYTLAYEYTLAGAVKQVTDLTAGTSFTNTYDDAGRVASVSAVGYNNVQTQFVNSMQYRAWGALKAVAYSNDTNLSLGYTPRRLVSNFALSGLKLPWILNPPNYTRTVGSAYQYHADGQIKFAQDQTIENGMPVTNGVRDRAYAYDFAGRLAEAYSGGEARNYVNGLPGSMADGPYRQSYSYDRWDNLVASDSRFWSRSNITMAASYDAAGRNPDWEYDPSGHLISRLEPLPEGFTAPYEPARWNFDAAGRAAGVSQTRSRYTSPPDEQFQTHVFTNTTTYDGDGQVVRYTQTHLGNSSHWYDSPRTTYYLRATVLGGAVVSEYVQPHRQAPLDWAVTHVYAGQLRVGAVGKYQDENHVWQGTRSWRAQDPVTGDELGSSAGGAVAGQTTLAPQGVDVGLSDPFPPNGAGDEDGLLADVGAIGKESARLFPLEAGAAQCWLDGLLQNCSFIGEATQQCPHNDCGARRVTVTARNNGAVVASTTFWRWSGQAGWDGALDGTYHTARSIGAWFDFGMAAGGRSFLDDVARNGGISTDWYRRGSGAGGSGGALGALGANDLFPALTPQNHPTIDQLRNSIEELLNNSDGGCGKYVDSLIKRAAELFPSNGQPLKVLDTFDKIRSGKGGFYFAQVMYNGKPVGGLAGGSLGNNNAKITISPPGPNMIPIAWYAYTGLHEVIHHANDNSGYSDRALAEAARDLMSSESKAKSPLPDRDDVLSNGRYWNNELNAHCPRPATWPTR